MAHLMNRKNNCRQDRSESCPLDTERSRYKRHLIRLNIKKKWPTRTGMADSRAIFFCERLSYNENALYSRR